MDISREYEIIEAGKNHKCFFCGDSIKDFFVYHKTKWSGCQTMCLECRNFLEEIDCLDDDKVLYEVMRNKERIGNDN